MWAVFRQPQTTKSLGLPRKFNFADSAEFEPECSRQEEKNPQNRKIQYSYTSRLFSVARQNLTRTGERIISTLASDSAQNDLDPQLHSSTLTAYAPLSDPVHKNLPCGHLVRPPRAATLWGHQSQIPRGLTESFSITIHQLGLSKTNVHRTQKSD